MQPYFRDYWHLTFYLSRLHINSKLYFLLSSLRIKVFDLNVPCLTLNQTSHRKLDAVQICLATDKEWGNIPDSFLFSTFYDQYIATKYKPNLRGSLDLFRFVSRSVGAIACSQGRNLKLIFTQFSILSSRMSLIK